MQERIDQFHDELCAAIFAKVPISIDSGTFSRAASVSTVEHLRRQMIEQNARSLESQAVGPVRYLAAWKVFLRTGSMAAVLDGLSVDRRVERQFVRLVRAPLLYLLLMIVLAFLGLFFFAVGVVPSFELIRDDFHLPLVINAPDRKIPVDRLKSASIVLALFATAVGVFLLCGGSKTIVKWLGGSLYYRCQVRSTALRVAETLIARDVHPADALRLSCDLVGTDERCRASVIGAVHERGGRTRSFRALYDRYQHSARSRLALLRVVIPTVIVSLLGGTLVSTD